MHAVFKTDKGKIREANEDFGGVFFNEDDQLLAIVADGMGGHQAGDVASRLAVEQMKGYWESTRVFTDVKELEVWLETVVKEVNDDLKDHAQNNEECKGMGTTLIAAAVLNNEIVVAHIGDSRLYHVTEETIEQKTTDHSFVNELVLQGHITKEEAESHPRKNVLTRALGTEEEVNVDTLSYEWQNDTYCLLCTDGLTNKLPDEDILHIVNRSMSNEEKVDQLLEEANQRGGEDNITVALISLESGDQTWT
ncbi:Stp1/IreP family PP2C-type Ser/Thr phosphatase [Alkalibacillus haloalkaliphilus]|uniref:protein-serine/threonine phosphatase n=1 Tax=Alkalibacillus haloalkaliphilus TaxID=94136 RepID=A0A511W1B8_9BACI|nr:Stp1/IreP family PP2C-type Ser/Thr phosphatase [Alkalibacillus haloalkaliphilus]GEN44866.1 protein phosphatase [Alkalibacillus haloalkaliphilus]